MSSIEVPTTRESQSQPRPAGRTGWLWVAFSLIALLALLWGFVALDPLESLTGSMPPVEDLAIQRTELGDYGIRLSVVNGSPGEITIAQVLVDEAYWSFEISPGNTLPRLGTATITIPYPWVEGEAHEVLLLTSTGATFPAEIEVAVATPPATAGSWWTLGLLGLYVGIVPVSLGLVWYPALRSIGRKGMHALLALTVGLLVFLLVDTVVEALEQAQALPGALEGGPAVWLVTLLSFLLLVALGRRGDRSPDDTAPDRSGLRLATFIALGIGLHNLGEGLAIGAAFNLGEAALGSFLVVGFTLHNLTEGIGICAPVVKSRLRFAHFAGLALLAGGPAIVGTWMGAFSFNPLWATLFLGIGAGAIAQVVYEVARLIWNDAARTRQPALGASNLTAFAAGIAIMYATALFVGV